jgi:hypothetical protein
MLLRLHHGKVLGARSRGNVGDLRLRPPLRSHRGKVLGYRDLDDTAGTPRHCDGVGPRLTGRQPRLPDRYAVRKVLLRKASEPKGHNLNAAGLSDPLVAARDLAGRLRPDQDLDGNLKEDPVAPERHKLGIP